jgi:hypothetical protein
MVPVYVRKATVANISGQLVSNCGVQGSLSAVDGVNVFQKKTLRLVSAQILSRAKHVKTLI